MRIIYIIRRRIRYDSSRPSHYPGHWYNPNSWYDDGFVLGCVIQFIIGVFLGCVARGILAAFGI